MDRSWQAADQQRSAEARAGHRGVPRARHRAAAGRLRTALDVDELMQDWGVACFAGDIIPSGSRVRSTARLADASPRNTLQCWLNAACRWPRPGWRRGPA